MGWHDRRSTEKEEPRSGGRCPGSTVSAIAAPARRLCQLTGIRLHTLSAYELYTANLTPYLQQATQELEGKLQSTQDDNAKLMTTIEQQRAELEQLLNGLEMAIKDIEGAVQALPTADQGGVEGLRNHVWEIEQELSAHR